MPGIPPLFGLLELAVLVVVSFEVADDPDALILLPERTSYDYQNK